MHTTITICSLFLSAYNLVLFSALNWGIQRRNFTQDCLNYNWLLLALPCLAFLYMHIFSLQNVLKVECSHCCIGEISIVTACLCAFSYLSVPYACCWWFIWKVFWYYVDTISCCVCFLCVCISCLFHTHGLCSCRFFFIIISVNYVVSISLTISLSCLGK